MIGKFRQFIGLILSVAFVATALFGLNMGMDTRTDGSMSGCMFDSSVTCQMNYGEHIQYWQQTFTAVQPTQDVVLAVVVVFFAGAAFFAIFSHRQNLNQTKLIVLQTVQRERDIIAKLSNHILQALSDGILNPKIYNPIAINYGLKPIRSTTHQKGTEGATS